MTGEIEYPSPEVIKLPWERQEMSMGIKWWAATEHTPEHFNIGWAHMTRDQVSAFGRQLLEITGDGPRKRLYGLTADEWLHLAADGQDSEVAPCCGNISELREYLNALATCQGEGESGIMLRAVLESYEAAASDHDTLADETAFPLLHRVLAGIRAEQAAQEEFARAYQAMRQSRE